jgi:hypothetical protein
MKTIQFILLISFLAFNTIALAQKDHHHHAKRGHNKRLVVVKRSQFRPQRAVVYHPYWRPAYSCQRRWVYFPNRNMYWDNWRNHYLFYNGTVWVSQPNVPTTIVNINLEKERTVELKDDDVDDIYASNDQHKITYKNE